MSAIETTTELTAAEKIAAEMARQGLTIVADFVPFSKSRNASEERPNLNWRVTLMRNGRQVLTCDYSAGSGHCPAYNLSVESMGSRDSVMRANAIAWECENGKAYRPGAWGNIAGKPIQPEPVDVMASLVMDCDVLEYATFENWAISLGYYTDSRKAESIYRQCLEYGLKMRAALGDDGLATLRDLCAEY